MLNVDDTRTRQRVLEAACELIAQRGLKGEVLKDSAVLAGYPIERAEAFFRRDEDLVIALYARLAAQFESRVTELPEGDVATRFRAAMLFKVELVAPYRETLASLLATLLDPRHELGALSPQMEVIRTRVMGVFYSVVLGASGVRKNSAEVVHSLYAAHLVLMLLWSQDRSPDAVATRAAIDIICDVLSLSSKLSWLPNFSKTLDKLETVSAQFVEPPPAPEQTQLSIEILKTLFRHRRLQDGAGRCAAAPCEQCLGLHLPKVRRCISAGEPIHFLFQIAATALFALALSIHLSWALNRWTLAALVAIGLVLGAAYSVKPVQLKGRGLAQLVCLWLIIFVGPMLFIAYLVNADLSVTVLVFAAAYGTLQMGIILVNTAEDYPEDLEAGITTSVVALGLHRGIELAFWLVGVGAVAALIMLEVMLSERGIGPLFRLTTSVPPSAACFYVLSSIARLRRSIKNKDVAESIQRVKRAAKAVPLWVTVVAWSMFGATFMLFYLTLLQAQGVEIFPRTFQQSAKGAKYESQGQVRSEAEHVAPGNRIKLALSPERA